MGFVAAETFSPSCCLYRIGKYAYRHRLMGGNYEDTGEMASGAMIQISSFITTGFSHSYGRYKDIQRA
jgi:hypothetical protein